MSSEQASSSENLIIDSAWGQIVGTRKSQQDHAAIVNWPNGFSLAILADGMGGHAGGAEASHLVVNTFRESFVESKESDIRQRFLEGLSAANLAVYDYAKEHPELEGMGSTFLAVTFDGTAIQWISVGDSPLWLFRDGTLRQINENHSMAAVLAKQVEEGLISEEEAASSPERSQLLDAVLGKDIKMVDAPEELLPVQHGDIIILASDGVETCSLTELQDLLIDEVQNSTSTAEKIVARILASVEAHQRPSQDNSTLNVLRVINDQEQIDTVQQKES
jgi:serine/threonine protein phosphatase PrpC